MPLTEINANRVGKPSQKIKDGKENSLDESASKKPSTPNTKKRRSAGGAKSSEDVENQVPPINQNESISIEYDCDEIRAKISAYVKQKDVRVTDFRKALHVTQRMCKAFIGESAGPGNGLKNKTYSAARQFFTDQEPTGNKSESSSSKKRKSNDKKETSKSADNDMDALNADDMPPLDGQVEGTMKIYDTCDDIRNKIDAHLRNYSVTKAALAKEFSKGQPMGAGPINPTDITKLSRRKGPLAGNSTKVFYAAYVYFERLRIKQGKDKSKKRKEIEEVHGDKGVSTDRAWESTRFKVTGGTKIWAHKYGKPRNSKGTW